MATYKGHDIAPDDQGDTDLKLRGGRVPGLENIEEELNLPEDRRLDHIRRPGEKGYSKEMHMAGEPEWDPKTGKEKPPKPTPIRAGGSPSGTGGHSIPIGPGSSMKSSRPPSYKHGGMVKSGSPKVSAQCADTKTIKCS